MNSRRATRPHRRATTAVTVALAAVLAVTAVGCGTSPSQSNDTAGSAPRGAPEEFGLTLSELAARIEETERLIARCMTDAGFQYLALDFVSVKKAMDSDQSAPGLTSEDYVKQFGLGITTQFDQPIVSFGAGPQNMAALGALPAGDQVAFRRALWGESTDWNHAHALEAEDFSETGGCTRAAAEQTYTPTDVSGGYVNPADRLLEQDPRMIAAIAQWADCMRAEGYEYDTPTQVEDDLRSRLEAVLQGQDPVSVSGATLAALTELQGEELAVAALLTSCEEEHIEPVQAAIESELYGAPPS